MWLQRLICHKIKTNWNCVQPVICLKTETILPGETWPTVQPYLDRLSSHLSYIWISMVQLMCSNRENVLDHLGIFYSKILVELWIERFFDNRGSTVLIKKKKKKKKKKRLSHFLFFLFFSFFFFYCYKF